MAEPGSILNNESGANRAPVLESRESHERVEEIKVKLDI